MPLLRFYLPLNLLTTEEKTKLAADLTKIYMAGGLPAFYVNVFFLEIPTESFYVGGKQAPTFVRLVCEHIARTMPDTKSQQRYLRALDRILTPLFESKGYQWEYHVIESPRELWKIQGLVPPPGGSEAEKMWKRVDQAVPFDVEDGKAGEGSKL
jgi:phenylpyruvate tautomerase PptA (4-oxalocrotonate tautomerase family)